MDPENWSHSQDQVTRSQLGPLENVLAAIQDCWERTPQKRWLMRRGDHKLVGDLELTVLHPTERLAAAPQADLNRLSSALWVTWHQTRLLLGADVNKATDWEEISSEFSNLNQHTALKIPHHAASASLHSSFTAPSSGTSRVWIATPYSRGYSLPRFEDGEGMSRYLAQYQPIYLTSHPKGIRGAEPSQISTRQDLLNWGRTNESLSMPPGQVSELYGYVIAGFDESGSLKDLHTGPGSFSIVESMNSP